MWLNKITYLLTYVHGIVTCMWPSVYWLYFKGVKGKSVKLRCASVKEAEDWKEALEAESAASVDSSTVPEESSATEVRMKISLRICLVLQKC